MNKFKFIKHFLDSQSSEIDGYTYKFTNVQKHNEFDDGIELSVNIETENPNRPYSMTLFVERIAKTIENLSNYFGENVPYSLRLKSDTLGDLDGYVHVPEEKKVEIITELNRELSSTEIPSELGPLKINFYYIFTEINGKMFYQDSVNDSITFNLPVKVTKITNITTNEDLKPNPKKVDMLAGVLEKWLIDSESYGGVDIRENILYDKLKEINFTELEDLYIDTNVRIVQILGHDVTPNWDAVEIEKDFFIE